MLVALALVACGGLYFWLNPSEENETPLATNREPAKSSSSRPFAQPAHKVESFPFDPNTADSTQLLRLGLTPAQVRGIYKFRSMGYTYGSADDFSHVPGLTQGQWEHLQPLIRIAPEFRPVTPKPRVVVRPATVYVDAPKQEGEATQPPHQVKLTEGETVDLNTADTTELKKVPGIGSYFARQIVSQRKRLGGFTSVDQLAEIRDFPGEALPYFEVSPNATVQKIQINRASKRTLLSHPYINAEVARAIWEHTHNEGPIRNAEDLKSLPGIKPSEVEQLLPYIDFTL